MKQTMTGGYDLDTIKYFRATGNLDIVCPHCGHTYRANVGDDFIEYPEAKVEQVWDCDTCEQEFKLLMTIEMSVKIDYETEKV